MKSKLSEKVQRSNDDVIIRNGGGIDALDYYHSLTFLMRYFNYGDWGNLLPGHVDRIETLKEAFLDSHIAYLSEREQA